MQRTADCQHHVAQAGLPPSDGFAAPAATCDPAVDLVKAHAPSSQRPMPRGRRWRQRVAARLLHRREDVHAVQRARLTTQVLPPRTPRRQRLRRGLGEALVMDTARRRLAQAQEAPGLLDQQQVCQPGPCFLAAITRLRCSRVGGARQGSLGPSMTQRGGRWVGGPALPPRGKRPPAPRGLPPRAVRGGPRPGDRGPLPRSVAGGVTPAVRRASMGSPWTGACHTRARAGVAWGSA
jgi:hypothetical protein